MRILITNDDGINAPGLATLQGIATTLAGDAGEVWTVAPAFEQSGVGHCISYARPFMVSQFGERRFAVEGSPADCVLAAIYDLMPERPDLVLSGVNRGNNAGENTLYSGTIGAAIEAALQGVRAIALSQFYGPANNDLDDPFEAAGAHGAELISGLLKDAIWGGETYQMFYNVNFPPCPATDVKGTAIVRQGMREGASFSVKGEVAPNRRRYLYVKGAAQDRRTAPGTDVSANLDGFVAVTPMRADLTDHAAVDALLGIKA